MRFERATVVWFTMSNESLLGILPCNGLETYRVNVRCNMFPFRPCVDSMYNQILGLVGNLHVDPTRYLSFFPSLGF